MRGRFLLKIIEINLLANGIRSLKEFYSRVLELPLLTESDNSFTVMVGSSQLTFSESPSNMQPYYHFAFNITNYKYEAALKWLKEKGITINQINESEIHYFKAWQAHSIYFYDPAGNIVGLIARESTQQQSIISRSNFSPTDILNVSEIGLPATDVSELSHYIQDLLNEQVYISSNTLFSPIGDEEGLIIISSLDRHWKGSNKQVKIFPVEVSTQSEKEGRIQLLHYPYSINSIK